MASAATAQDAVYKSLTDDEFLTEYRADPEAALEDFDLSEEEEDALMDGDDLEVMGAANDDDGMIAKAAVVVVVVVA